MNEGISVDAAQPLLMAAMMKVLNDPAKMSAIESPKDIAGGDQEDPTAKSEKIGEV
jgi:hypothetical protein